MANTAEGSFEIQSTEQALLDDLAQKVDEMSDKAMFSYGSMGSFPEVTLSEGTLFVAFTSKWRCTAVFDWLDSLLESDTQWLESGTLYEHRDALIQASMQGQGREVATFYKEVMKKNPGEDDTSRTIIDLEEAGFWGMLQAAGGFDMASGEEREALGECYVSIHCHERKTLTDEQCATLFEQIDENLPWGEEVDRDVTRPLTEIRLTVQFQCQGVRCTIILNGDTECWHTVYEDDCGDSCPEDSGYHGEMLEDLSTI